MPTASTRFAPGWTRGASGFMVTEQKVGHCWLDDAEGPGATALIAVYGTDYGAPARPGYPDSPTWPARPRHTGGTRAPRGRHGAHSSADRRPGPQHRHAGRDEPGLEAARVVKRTAPESLLDTYQAERHPVGASVVRNTMAQVALACPGDRQGALREAFSELLELRSLAGGSPG